MQVLGRLEGERSNKLLNMYDTEYIIMIYEYEGLLRGTALKEE